MLRICHLNICWKKTNKYEYFGIVAGKPQHGTGTLDLFSEFTSFISYNSIGTTWHKWNRWYENNWWIIWHRIICYVITPNCQFILLFIGLVRLFETIITKSIIHMTYFIFNTECIAIIIN